jgi:ATP-dependent Clp protease ATP-binding subunit ClpB
LLKERGVTIAVTDKAKDLIVQEGYDPAFGARPIKRVLQHRIADPLAVQILEGGIEDGEHILVDAVGNELTFTAIESLEA